MSRRTAELLLDDIRDAIEYTDRYPRCHEISVLDVTVPDFISSSLSS